MTIAEARQPVPADEPAYLRRLLERAPVCLVRVRLDGRLLACNDAALRLFAAGTLRAILDTNLVDRIVETERAGWQAFTTSCSANGASSMDCQLVIPGGEVRPVLVQGVALHDHPDGIDSLLLSLRDQSHTHLLERAIKTAEMNRVRHEERQRAARHQFEQAIAEHLKAAAFAGEPHVGRQQPSRPRETHTADERAKQRSLETALAAAQTEVDALGRRVQASTDEQQRLEALVAQSESARAQATAEHRAALVALEELLSRTREQAAFGREQSHRVIDELRAQLSAEQAQLAAQIEEHQRERDALTAVHQRAIADLETRNREIAAQLRVRQTQLAQTTAEQVSLAARVEAHEHERDHVIAAHQQALTEAESSRREILTGLREELAHAYADLDHLAARADEQSLEQDRMRAEHRHALADLETRKREALAELHAQLSQAMADARLLIAHAEVHERERERMSAEHQLAIAELQAGQLEAVAEVRAQLSQSAADNRRLAARAEEYERERERTSAEHQLAITGLQAEKVAAVAELRTQLSQIVAERSRMAVAFEEHERRHHEAVAEFERTLNDVRQSLRVRNSPDVVERGPADTVDEGTRVNAEGEPFAGLEDGLAQAFSDMAAVAETPAITSKAAPPHVPFDSVDETFVRRLLAMPDERASFEPLTDGDATEPPAESDAFAPRPFRPEES